MRDSFMYGSVWEAAGNGGPYREHRRSSLDRSWWRRVDLLDLRLCDIVNRCGFDLLTR